MPLFCITIFTLSLLHSSVITCMESPDALIISNMHYPKRIMHVHGIYQFSWIQLQKFHDQQGNNLLHITVRELQKQTGSARFPDILNECRPLITYLLDCGVKKNACNNQGETPLQIAYTSTKQEKHAALLENFLENHLEEDPSENPNVPAWTSCDTLLGQLFCLSWWTGQDNS